MVDRGDEVRDLAVEIDLRYIRVVELLSYTNRGELTDLVTEWCEFADPGMCLLPSQLQSLNVQ